ncbi:unnamed protein product [Caenorhabditis auriculariae]|uniref:phytanoyl-CoA dioxygenase n=1 Tax=Caenorhabditis auriculariae TaxID=2777116 RepID=A0A8S1HUP5_9PELO|nr:unnamed protein product [Caenorhabditis auriculariae]
MLTRHYSKLKGATKRIIGGGLLDWTKQGNTLSLPQKVFFEKNGFLVVNECVIQGRLNDLPISMTVMKDVSIKKSEFEHSEKAITKIQDFADDPVLFEYCKNDSIVNVVKDLIGGPDSNLMAMHTMLINKPPDSGKLTSRHPHHQDLIYFPFRPADFICCAWTAMEKITKENGCLEVVPGSHKLELLPHGYPDWEGGVNKAYYGIQNYDPSMERVFVEMNPGDTVFFHPVLVHGSGANQTKGYRKAISCHYANDDKCHYIEVKGTQQEQVGDEIVEMVRKNAQKFGLKDGEHVDFAKTWRLRGRPITGKRRNL